MNVSSVPSPSATLRLSQTSLLRRRTRPVSNPPITPIPPIRVPVVHRSAFIVLPFLHSAFCNLQSELASPLAVGR